jgi:S1-C subfamily serine protease
MSKVTVLRDGEEVTFVITLVVQPQDDGIRVQPRRDVAAGAWLGIQGLTIMPEIAGAMDLSDDQQGVLVEQVVGDSPAGKAGLRGSDQAVDLNGQRIAVGGDIIVAMDDQPVAQMEDLLSVLQGAEPGQELTLTLVRDGLQVELEVTLGERPAFMP